MRKPRDFDSEMKLLGERAKMLKERKLHRLGELVVVTGADALPVEQLTGALLAAAQTVDAATKEGWRAAGAGFFQRTARAARGRVAQDAGRRSAGDGSTQSSAGEAGA